LQLYKRYLGWTDGLSALIFHGQHAEVANIYNLTNTFSVAALYGDTRFAEVKLMLGYIIGVTLRYLTAYSEGHYLLTDKGAQRQFSELSRRNLMPEDVWIMN
jgi:hypothetical protein